MLRYPGNTNNLEPAVLYLYRDWLPRSGEEARDFPASLAFILEHFAAIEIGLRPRQRDGDLKGQSEARIRSVADPAVKCRDKILPRLRNPGSVL